MARVLDVGRLVTEMIPGVDGMKLCRLCFLAQGWHLAWTGAPLFEEPLCAGRKGPVPVRLREVIEVVEDMANEGVVAYIPGGCSDRLSLDERKVVTAVVEFYRETHSREIALLSRGRAWRKARNGLDDWDPSSAVMSISIIREEFMELIRKSEVVPQPPLLDFSGERFSYENILRAVDEVEQNWKGTFNILASI